MARRGSLLVAVAVCTAFGALDLGDPAEADAAKRGVRLSDKVAVPGQVLTATGAKLKKAKVAIGGRKAKVLSRSKKGVSFQVPRLKPGRYRVVVAPVRSGGRRGSG